MDSYLPAMGNLHPKPLGDLPDSVLLYAENGLDRRTGDRGRKHLHIVLIVGLIRTILAAVTATIALVLLLPLFLLILPFWLVSVLTRGIARMIEPEFLTREQLIQFDPVFGWRARPNLDTHHLMVDVFHIRTDQDGWRGDHSLTESDIVVFGDSFAAGYGVSDRHFFANLSGGYKIKSVGIGGYSMVQELLWMTELKNSLHRKLVVWFIYYGNDLFDNLMPDLRGYRKPFVRENGVSEEWEMVSSHVAPEQWPVIHEGRMQGQHHNPKLAELCSETFLAKRAYAASEYLIGKGKQICDEVEAQLVVVGIPDAIQLTTTGRQNLKALGGESTSFDADRPDKELARICDRRGVQFQAGKTFLDAGCYKINDCHWNEKGHRRVCEAVNALARNRRGGARAKSEPAESGAFVQA